MKEPIWKKIVSEHIVCNTGRRETVRSGTSENDEFRTKTGIMFYNNKRMNLCLLNPHSDKPSKMIPKK
jgi:hypothetical protein